MKFLFDLFPVILFFATFKVAQSTPDPFIGFFDKYLGGSLDVAQIPILAATLIAIIASVIQVAIVFARGKKPEVMLWISLAVIVVFGSLTLILHNAWFIKWKPSILYWIFATILFYGIATKKNLLGKLFKNNLPLPEKCWHTAQVAWALFFVFVGLANLAVAYFCSTETWVNFKLFGLLTLTILFTFAFAFWASVQIQNVEKSKGVPHEEN